MSVAPVSLVPGIRKSFFEPCSCPNQLLIVFRSVWGSSLAYVDEEGVSAAASPTVLKNKLLDDTQEIAIFSDAPCDESCGATRPDSVAYSMSTPHYFRQLYHDRE